MEYAGPIVAPPDVGIGVLALPAFVFFVAVLVLIVTVMGNFCATARTEKTPSDLLVCSASEYVLAAASLAPKDHAALFKAHQRFRLTYNTLAGPRDLSDDAVAYFYARCVLNAHQMNVKYLDASLECIKDGWHKPFTTEV